MHKEYRRFLLKKEISSLLEDLNNTATKMAIFFTKIKLCKEIKYERTGKHYTKMIQTGAPYARSTVFKRIGKKTFQKKQAQNRGTLLHLKRYRLKVGTCTVHVDVYNHELKTLHLLTVPHRCFDMQDPSLLHHSFLEEYIETEVTDDPRYEQKYLALFGNPTKHPYNIYTIFKDLETKRLRQPQDIIFKEMKSADAVRIFLYDKYLLIQHHAQQIKKSKSKEAYRTIEAFREEVTRSIAIIRSYEEIFDEQQYQKIMMHLYRLLRVTKIYHDLILIYKKLTKLNRSLQSTYIDNMRENIQSKLETQAHKIGNYFESREFAIISTQYLLFIREKRKSYTNYESQLPFGYSAKMKVQLRYSELLQAINFLDGCNDEKSYEKLKSGFEELIDFVTIFETQIDSGSCKPLLKNATKIYRKLQKYDRRNKYLLILKMVAQHLHKREEEKTSAYIEKKRKKLLAKQKRFDQNIFKFLDKFKEATL